MSLSVINSYKWTLHNIPELKYLSLTLSESQMPNSPYMYYSFIMRDKA